MGEYFDTAVLEPGKERLEGYAQAFQKLSDTFREMPTEMGAAVRGRNPGNFSGCAGNRMRVLQAQGNLLGAAVLPDIPTDLCLLKCSGDCRKKPAKRKTRNSGTDAFTESGWRMWWQTVSGGQG